MIYCFNIVNLLKTEIFKRLYEKIDSIKVDATPLPLIVVGGGSMLAPETMGGISEVVHVQHNEVANAVGAAIAQVSGEIDHVYRDLSRQGFQSPNWVPALSI